MTPVISRWPVCGTCCEVAPYSWLGEPHRCVQDAADRARLDGSRSVSPYGSIAIRADNFAYCLGQAISDGERSGHGDMGLDDETLVAIAAVADEYPDVRVATIAAAHEAFARDIRGIHYNESQAVYQACHEGAIAPRTRPAPPSGRERAQGPRSTYGPDSITILEPDPVAAREWILANRANPSELYRRLVVNGDWHHTCEPPTSFVVGHRLHA